MPRNLFNFRVLSPSLWWRPEIFIILIFFTPSSGSEPVVQVIAASVHNQNGVTNSALNLATPYDFPIACQGSISINHEKWFVHHFELSVETVYTEEWILRNLAQYLWRHRKWILRKKLMSWLLINETVQKVRNVS